MSTERNGITIQSEIAASNSEGSTQSAAGRSQALQDPAANGIKLAPDTYKSGSPRNFESSPQVAGQAVTTASNGIAASQSVNAGAYAGPNGIHELIEIAARTPAASDRNSAGSNQISLEQDANALKPVPDGYKPATSVSSRFQEASQQDAPQALRSNSSGDKSVSQSFDSSDQGPSAPAVANPPVSASSAVLVNGTPATFPALSPFSSSMADLLLSSNPLPQPAGASQKIAPDSEGASKSSIAMNAAGDGSDREDGLVKTTSESSARSSAAIDEAIGNQAVQAEVSNSPKATPAASKSVSPNPAQVPQTSKQTSVPSTGNYLSRADSLLQLSRLVDQGLPTQTPQVPLTSTINSNIASGTSAPIAVQAVATPPGAHAPESGNVLPSSGRALENTGTSGAVPSKSPNDVSTSGDPNSSQGDATQTVPQSSAHSSTITNQPAPQQAANLSRPAPEASNAASPQGHGSALQSQPIPIGATSGRTENTPQTPAGDVKPTQVPSSGIPAASVLNAAGLIQKMGATEMRFAVDSNEFGSISIRTSLSQQQMMAQITVDHGGLGTALSAHVPTLEAKLGNELGLRTLVQVNHSAMSSSGERGQSSQGGQRNSQPASVPSEVCTSPVETEDSGLRFAALSTVGDRLDVQA